MVCTRVVVVCTRVEAGLALDEVLYGEPPLQMNRQRHHHLVLQTAAVSTFAERFEGEEEKGGTCVSTSISSTPVF